MRAGGLAGSVGIGTVVGWSMSNVGAVAPELSQDYRITIATVGLLTTVVFVVHTLMQIPAGRIVDRFGPRRMGLLGLVLIGLTSALPLLALEPWLAFVARFLLGIGTGIGFMSGVEYSRQTSGSPFVLGIYGASTGLGGGLAVAIVPQVEHAIHWRAPFVTAALLAVVALVILLLGPAEDPAKRAVRHAAPHPAPGAGGSPAPDAPAKSVLRDGRVWRLGLMMAAPSGMSLIVGTWVVTLLVKAGGYSTREAGLIGSFVMIAGIVTRPISGWVMRSHPERMRAVIVASAFFGVLGVLALAEARIFALVAVGSVLVGLCSGLPFAYGYTMAPRVRPDAPGVAAAMVNACGLSLIVSSIPLVGLTFSLPGNGRIGFFAAAALWAVSALFLPPPHKAAGPGQPPVARA